MAAFNDPYVTTDPLGSADANTLDNIIRELKSAIDERQTLEHYSYETGANETTSATAMGRHVAGKVGVFGYGTTAERAAVTLPGVGALWEITDADGAYPAGTLFRYTTASGWIPSQLGTGVIYATDAEAIAGTVEDKSVNPKQLQDNLHSVQNPFYNYAHFREEQTSGSASADSLSVGSFAIRTINTTKTNRITGVSLATNQLTLPAGTFYIKAVAPCDNANSTGSNSHSLRLWDTTAGSTALYGSGALVIGGAGVEPVTQNNSFLTGEIVLSEESVLELQHYMNTNGAGGRAITTGEPEVYSEIEIWKLDV